MNIFAMKLQTIFGCHIKHFITWLNSVNTFSYLFKVIAVIKVIRFFFSRHCEQPVAFKFPDLVIPCYRASLSIQNSTVWVKSFQAFILFSTFLLSINFSIWYVSLWILWNLIANTFCDFVFRIQNSKYNDNLW